MALRSRAAARPLADGDLSSILTAARVLSPVTYKDAGVDIREGARFADRIYALMQSTFDGRVLANPGGFGALYSLDYDDSLFRRDYLHPVLVGSTDGVGTKLKVASMAGCHDTVGIDLVAMCANDILTVGAEPLFFLDYLATGRLEPDVMAQVVAGIAAGCKRAGCALVGGETAEMPGFYGEGEYDAAGFIVGIVEKRRLITGDTARPGDVVIGLASSGLHSNGFSLVRKVLFEDAGLRCSDSLAQFGLDCTVADELLKPTRIYVRGVRSVLRHYRVKQVVRGIAHITGGGLVENIPRVLPEGCGVSLDTERWHRPGVFEVVQRLGDVSDDEMYRTFNMGIGMVLVVSPYYAESVLRRLRRVGEEAAPIGEVVAGQRRVSIT
jgi:phosphoribosylformylglycinamidine cyclo-ligase